MIYVAAAIVTLCSFIGVGLTFVMLPGIWFMIAVALLCQIWIPGMFSPWTLISVVVIGILAEAAEFFASAGGAAKAGGSKAGMVGSIVGSIIGLIVGQILIPIPIIGALIGAVLGAGIGTITSERGIAQRTWSDSYRSGKGAAVGRLLSTVIKTGFACVVAMILVVGAFVP